jgi:hypothetical protein
LLWSENGAVKNYAKRKGLLVIHGELGATRPPFHRTVYFDPRGTNGNALVVDAPIHCLADHDIVPAETWQALCADISTEPTALGVEDSSLTYFSSKFICPPGAYIFIPLQLSDDLNLLLNSSFRSPLEFLERVLPPLLAQGLRVVIKGHPAAESRPTNLIAETHALRYAGALQGVTLLDRASSSQVTLNAIGGAKYVLTINSSLGFEALLMGKRSILCGKAAYDIEGRLYRGTEDLADLDSLPWDQDWVDRLTTFLCRYYYHPQESVENGSALLSAINLLSSTPHLIGSVAFWIDWIRVMDFGSSWAKGIEFQSVVTSISHRGGMETWRSTIQRITLCGNGVLVVGRSNGASDSVIVHATSNRYTGWIEQMMLHDDGYSIVGWAAIEESHAPPVSVFLLKVDEVIAAAHVLEQRNDVLEYLGSSGTSAFGFAFHKLNLNVADLPRCSLSFLSADNSFELVRLENPTDRAGFVSANW